MARAIVTGHEPEYNRGRNGELCPRAYCLDVTEHKVKKNTRKTPTRGHLAPNHHSVGETLSIIGLVAALLMWAFPPWFGLKVAAVPLAALGLIYLSHRSHFVRNQTVLSKNIVDAFRVW